MTSLFANIISYIRETLRGIGHIPNLRLSQLRKVFSLMGKKEKIAFWVLLCIALLNMGYGGRNIYYAHTVSAPTYCGIYEEGMVGQPTYINPLLGHSDVDVSLEKLVYSGLYKLDKTGSIIPDLADGLPQISDDQKQYTINLKHTVRWHNDKQFTADDVVFTIQTLQDPAFKSPLRGMWLSTSVEKLSDYQIRFTTKDVSGPFLQNLTLPILPQSIWGKVDPSLFLTSVNNLQAVGTGPYAIKEIRKQSSGKVDQISLDSYSNYFNGKPKIDSIIIKFYDNDDDLLNAFHSKDILSLGYIASGSSLYVEPGNDTQVLTAPLPQYQVLFYNLTNKALSDQQVRYALSLAINRQDIVNSVFKKNTLLPYSPFTFGENDQPADAIVFDAAKAATTLDAAGWKVDSKTNIRTKNSKPLQVNLATNDSLLNSKTAELIANAWRQMNIQVNLTVLPTKQLTDSVIRTRNFDALIFPLKFGTDPDPFIFFHSSQVRDPGINLTGFSDQSADKLMTEARTTTNMQLREEKYSQLNQLMAEKLPVLFLNQSEYFYAIDKSVSNVSLQTIFDPSDRFYDTPNWYMQKHRVWK